VTASLTSSCISCCAKSLAKSYCRKKTERERELAKKPSTEILQQDCIPFVIYWSALLRVGDREYGGESRGGKEEGRRRDGEKEERDKGRERKRLLLLLNWLLTTLVLSFILFFLHIFHFPGQAGCPPLPPSVTQALILFQLNTNLGRACSN
jgi:hypothetical protein